MVKQPLNKYKKYLLLIDYGNYEGWRIDAQADTLDEIVKVYNNCNYSEPKMIVTNLLYSVEIEE